MDLQTSITVISLLIAFVLGAVFGRLLPGTPHSDTHKPTSETAADSLPEDKVAKMRKEAEEDAEAFNLLMGYSRDLAYGQTSVYDLKHTRGGNS